MNLHEHKNIETPTVLVVFGATGDLMTKKIAPALYELFLSGQLPELFSVVGSSRRDLDDKSFREYVKDILTKKNQDDKINDFLAKVFFHKAEFSNPEDYQSLAQKLGMFDKQWQTCANKLFYLAIPPNSYELLFQQLAESGLTKPCSDEEGWTRVIVEKPFGYNVNSAEKLDSLLASLFKEEQIYRIDHYLGKEMVQNILVFRFANNLFERIWDNQNIESINITLNEELGVEKRGSFYDSVGALRDVGQNHMLQILAFITMENPLSFDVNEIRKMRAQILETLPQLSENEIKNNTARYQHENYQNIKGVNNDSQKETYFKLQFSLDHPRWRNVPITIKGGKRTGETKKEILVTFKHPEPCLCPEDAHIRNSISIRFDDKEQIAISLWTKKPGFSFEIEEKELSLLYENNQKQQYTSEYQHLLLDCIAGNQMLFVDTNEVQAMWQFIDQIISAWEKNLVPLENYTVDTLP